MDLTWQATPADPECRVLPTVQRRHKKAACHSPGTTEGAKVSEQEYSLQGYFELAAEGGMVVLRCSWPFDFNADEWIYIKNRYSAIDYSKAVSDAAARDRKAGRTYGINGGFLEITQLNSGFLIEFSRPQSGWCGSSLQLHVRRPVGELSLQSLPFRVIYGRLFAQHSV